MRVYTAHNVAAGFMRNIFTYCEAGEISRCVQRVDPSVHYDFRKRYDAPRRVAPRRDAVCFGVIRFVLGKEKEKSLEEQRGYTETPISPGSRAK